MSNYQHGIYGSTNPTVMPPSNVAEAGITVVVGTAPVNMLANPQAAVGVPLLLNDIDDVKSMLGYSTDVDSYTIMQAVHAFFEVFNTAPLLAINVLDPTKHVTPDKTSNGAMANGVYTLGSTVNGTFVSDKGILPSTLVVKSSDGTTTYASGTDYTTAFNADGSLSITRVSSGNISSATATIQATYSILDPEKVEPADIVAGITLIDRVFQATNTVPEILIAPGYSHIPTVGEALIEAAFQVSTIFKATALVDIDSAGNTTIEQAISWKTSNGYSNRDVIPCYPKVMSNQGKVIYMSAMLAALIQTTDAQNESTPFVSPSNKAFNILATVLEDGTQALYTLDEANELNGEGIFTALNFQGWKAWGNNTGIYSWTAAQDGTTYDPKDQYINIKRAFDWQNNGFITRYFSRIDNPMNYRAIQTLITDENQFYNPFITAGYVAGMAIAYNQKDNPISQILAGKIVFKQYLSPYIPMQTIENDLQFDPSMLAAALGGAS